MLEILGAWKKVNLGNNNNNNNNNNHTFYVML